MCKQGEGDAHPQQACILDEGFLERVNRQRSVFITEQQKHESEQRQKAENLREKISDFVSRHAHDYSDGRQQHSGHVLCSLVNEITVDESQRKCPGRRLGHVFDIPDVGKMYLAELVITHGEFQLIMLRFELGCPVVGNTSAVTSRINGVSGP